MKSLVFLTMITGLFVSCNLSPKQITYGTDACHYCNMNIVDRHHASQIVTSKGKAYKYDAIECMLNSIGDEFKNTEVSLYLTADFNQPGQLTDATQAWYLISDQISSPMGANLSAFKDEKFAQQAMEKFTGKIFSWEEIQNHLK